MIIRSRIRHCGDVVAVGPKEEHWWDARTLICGTKVRELWDFPYHAEKVWVELSPTPIKDSYKLQAYDNQDVWDGVVYYSDGSWENVDLYETLLKHLNRHNVIYVRVWYEEEE